MTTIEHPDGERTGTEHLAHPRTAAVRDPALPALRELLASNRPAPLVSALGAAGLDVDRVMAQQVIWAPGSSARVVYRVRLREPLTGLSDEAGWFGPVVAATGRLPHGGLRVADGAEEVTIWRIPHDPALPGLASALDPGVAGALLTALGVPGPEVTPALRAYRPGRRAVVSIGGRDQGLYLKVLRPGRVERVHDRHLMLAGSLPVTRSLGFDPDLGVLALQVVPGHTLRESLDDPVAMVPTAEALADLLARLPDPGPEMRALSAMDRVTEMVATLTAILPEHAEDFAALGRRIDRPDRPTHPPVPVHGDFYEAQVLLDDGQISGLIDVDTFGWGAAYDDPATLIGHLSVYRAMAPHPERVAQYASGLLDWWEVRLDPVELRHRIAAVVLSLAPGAFRVQTPDWPTETLRRVALADAWVASLRS